MTRRLLVALGLVAFASTLALAECAPSAKGNVSTNKKWKIEPRTDNTFTLLRYDDTKKEFVEKTTGWLGEPGHHLVAYVADDGEHFVVWDTYAGIAIHASDGKLVRRITPEDMLSKADLAKRPGQWACHPEGKWSDGKVELTTTAVKVGLYTGATVELELATGEPWVKPGECDKGDNVKAHGLMSCLVKKWTCRRCAKEQESLVWRLCPACCKELGICLVCNEKVKKADAPK